VSEPFPAFLRLEGRRALLVGGGKVAASKLGALLAAGAKVKVVAPELRAELRLPEVEVCERPFTPADLEGVWFVVAAATPEVNRAVNAAAEPRCLFVNAVDDPAAATAYLGGVVRKAGVTLAISTGGRAPALAGLLREALERLLPDDLERWLTLAESMRAPWKQANVPLAARRPQLLEALEGLYR
jgi:uroporphyrin-III C-methyltransferase / precorrin-2 dehydrogenase / sirohydrochlorin ferrochelatase